MNTRSPFPLFSQKKAWIVIYSRPNLYSILLSPIACIDHNGGLQILFPLLQTLERDQINWHLIPVIANSSKRMMAHMVCFSYVQITVVPYHLFYTFWCFLWVLLIIRKVQYKWHICLNHMFVMWPLTCILYRDPYFTIRLFLSYVACTNKPFKNSN